MIICHNLTVSAFVTVQLSVKSGYGSFFAELLCAVLCNRISKAAEMPDNQHEC